MAFFLLDGMKGGGGGGGRPQPRRRASAFFRDRRRFCRDRLFTEIGGIVAAAQNRATFILAARRSAVKRRETLR